TGPASAGQPPQGLSAKVIPQPARSASDGSDAPLAGAPGWHRPLPGTTEESSMTQHDGTPPTPQVLSDTLTDLQNQGMDKAHQLLSELEPHLSAFARENATHIIGKLTLANAPRSVCRGVFSDVIGLVTLCFHAQRRGVHQLWQDTALGE